MLSAGDEGTHESTDDGGRGGNGVCGAGSRGVRPRQVEGGHGQRDGLAVVGLHADRSGDDGHTVRVRHDTDTDADGVGRADRRQVRAQDDRGGDPALRGVPARCRA
ncbi:hypothetical protein SBRY_30885 [Actinacidiphila bryophytorum]|uniref:Uncharacterized protein n=1 Tax=Actinacidiphila bryophytorum TaxID=1436133 RepID=A0A9W4H1Z9_9ACTN|nr:hypothetical protein SBRY_30885 [Actinacidiphila bryophytorum]